MNPEVAAELADRLSHLRQQLAEADAAIAEKLKTNRSEALADDARLDWLRTAVNNLAFVCEGTKPPITGTVLDRDNPVEVWVDADSYGLVETSPGQEPRQAAVRKIIVMAPSCNIYDSTTTLVTPQPTRCR